jgi:sigma-B regulation protein RsbU (phosphoserine phosphatase)
MADNKVVGKARRLRSSLSLNIIGAIVLLLILSSLITSAIGLASFTESFKKEYSATTYHMAETAAMLVEGDHLDEYLLDEQKAEYLRSRKYLNNYCRRMNVSLVYVIMVDTSDYGRFVSVFNSVNNSVDDTTYVEWARGYERETTNDEYRQKYKQIYENGSPYEVVYRTTGLGGLHPHITAMVPIKNSSRGVAGLLCIQRPISELEEARRPFLKEIALSAFLLAVFASIIAAVYIRRQFVDPITRISEEASRFARENTLGEPLDEISRLSEIANLADSITTMESDMVNYIENLTESL